MESLIWILLVVALFLLFFWKPQEAYDMASDQKQGVSPDIIQAIIEAVQKQSPDEVPLETLFINMTGPDTFSSRFMFFNTQGYFGTQYDVQAKVGAEGSVQILNMSTSAQVDKYDAGFTPFKPDSYTDYSDITKTSEAKLQSELTNFRKVQLDSNNNTDVFATKNVASKYNQNIESDKGMQKFFATEPQTSFTNQATASSYVPGPSPARAGGILAPGAKVFNMQ
jgi:hypothetical protein